MYIDRYRYRYIYRFNPRPVCSVSCWLGGESQPVSRAGNVSRRRRLRTVGPGWRLA